MVKKSVIRFLRACYAVVVSRFSWLVILSAIAAAIVPSVAYSQSTFTDMQGHWAQPCIEQLVQNDIITGYEDGTFRPNAPVTRAEFATMLGKAFPNAPIVRDPVDFVDIPTDYWAADSIQQVYQTGFLSGYLGQIFNPLRRILREQVWVGLASGLNYSPRRSVNETLSASFTDSATISNYARNAIAAATEKQIIVNYPNVRVLNPRQLATRAEVATSLCQALRINQSVPDRYIAKIPTGSIAPTASARTGNNAPKSEIRGVWITNIDSNVLFYPNRLTNALQTLKRLNFNTLYPTVWNWGYTLYPSQVARRVTGRAMRLVTPTDPNLNPDLGVQGRDVLAEIVTQAHQKGMTVIPWFEFGFMAPADSELAKRHPEWLLKRQNGTVVWKEGSHDRVWLNPFRPDVQQFIENLVVEIVTKYDVDGIQFDDHFGFPSEFGYDPFTVELYQQEHDGEYPPVDFKNAEWIAWRADKISEYMNRIYQAIKSRKPNAIVSVSPNPQEFSYNFFLADWQTWEEEGLIDELVLQVYRQDINVFIREIERPEVQAAQSRIPVAIGIITGVKPQPAPISQIQEQVQVVRDRNLAGVSFFFYESLWNLAKEPRSTRQLAFQRMFAIPVQRPIASGNRN